MVASVYHKVEERIQRNLLKEFIASEPSQVVFNRPVIIETDAGGKKQGPPTILPAQTVRLVPFVRRLSKMTRDTPDGNIINLQYVVVGRHDLDVKMADFFVHEDGIYDVVSIEPNRRFRTAVNVTYRGPNNDTWG